MNALLPTTTPNPSTEQPCSTSIQMGNAFEYETLSDDGTTEVLLGKFLPRLMTAIHNHIPCSAFVTVLTPGKGLIHALFDKRPDGSYARYHHEWLRQGQSAVLSPSTYHLIFNPNAEPVYTYHRYRRVH